jgi:hypothetical protein
MGPNKIIKIKGLRSKVEQITFIKDKHPTTGLVSTFSWTSLKNILDKHAANSVESIKIHANGIDVFWKNYF